MFASKNKGKITEVIEIFRPKSINILSLLGLDFPIIIENGLTFEANAKIKAETVFDALRVPVISDDSGLELEQLDGNPGVFSARYAGEYASDHENNEKLLNDLKNFGEPHFAKYVCAAVYYDGVNYFSAFGEIKGKIVEKGRGINGFGYDPYFIPVGYELTMAELNLNEKNIISHRAKAFKELIKIIINRNLYEK